MREPPAEVAAYLEAVPEKHRKALLRMRRTILSAAPTATEGLSYRIPTFFVDGRWVVYMAAFRNHCSLFGGHAAAAIARDYAGVTVVKSTIRFTPEAPLPAALVREVVRQRLAANAPYKPNGPNAKPPLKRRVRTALAPTRSGRPAKAASTPLPKRARRRPATRP